MTLALTTLNSNGIVVTADSRQTYRNNAGLIRIGSDTAVKIFKLGDGIGAAIAGKAFIADANGNLKPTGHFIDAFQRAGVDPAWTVRDVAERLNDYLQALFVPLEQTNLRQNITSAVTQQGGSNLVFGNWVGNILPYTFVGSDGQTKKDAGSFDTVDLLVAGFDSDGVGRSYSVHVPSGITGEMDTIRSGAQWIGQTEVVQRIVLGFDVSGGNLPFVKDALARDPVGTTNELAKLNFIINFGSMSLQDAIDFNVLITRTTESIQRFSDGTNMSPGGITGVGGPITVAAILPDTGFAWVTKKQLRAENSVLDLD
jgi:hypothetical protein